MCFFLYLASNNELKTKEWNEENLEVVISSKIDISFGETEKFKKENIYFVSSTEGCGCGFRQKFDVEHLDYLEIDQKLEKDKNHHQLFELIKKILVNEDYIELFGCWDGDQETKVEFRREVKLDVLSSETFYFREKELIKVTK